MDNAKYIVGLQTLYDILKSYGFTDEITDRKEYIGCVEVTEKSIFIKYVFGINLHNGQHLIVKLFHEEKDPNHERTKIENQSIFSEILRSNGIRTPKRYQNGGVYTTEYSVGGEVCIATVEDWCGEEIKEINTDTAYQIGVLMARIHTIAMNSGFKIGSKTLFCAASENDVDEYSKFCSICNNQMLNRNVVEKIKAVHDSRLEKICSLWESLPRSATQGDFSINNLSMGKDGIAVFDYNNAGDEALISDLILEGLLVAYEMDLPDETSEEFIDKLFLSFLNGYLYVRKLTETEREVAWDIYSLYHSLWFSKITHRDNSLEKLVSAEKFDLANELLLKMLSDITAQDDGRFERG